MIIRKLRKTDFEQYISLINGFRPIGMKINKHKFEEIYDKIFKTNVVLVCEDNGILVASITIILEQKFIHKLSIYGRIEDVYVIDAKRKCGLGKKMVQEALELCKNEGCYKIVLSCNKNLIYFYEKNGFEVRDINMSQLIT